MDALRQLTGDRLDMIDYLVINHAEGDHTGALVTASNQLTNAQLVCSDKCFCVLAKQYPNMRFTVHKDAVKEHVEFAYGYSLHLLPIPMLHWPESCVTILTFPDQAHILFSNDCFGQHVCAPSRVMTIDHVCELAHVYMINILYPFRRLLVPVLKQINENIRPEMILPAHGLCYLTPNAVSKIITVYEQLLLSPHCTNATIMYETIYGGCQRAAEYATQELHRLGWTVSLFDLKSTESATIATAIAMSQFVVVASPTFYGNITKVTAGCLTYFNNLRLFDGKNVLLLSSYGWSKVGARRLAALISSPFATREVEWIGAVTDEVKESITAALTDLVK